MTRRLLALVTPLALAACVAPADAGSGRSGGAAYTSLYEALGRPAGLRLDGDTAVTVTWMQGRRMSDAERVVSARGAARTVAVAWPTGRIRRVTTVFRQATRLGPFIVRTHDHVVTVADVAPRTETP